MQRKTPQKFKKKRKRKYCRQTQKHKHHYKRNSQTTNPLRPIYLLEITFQPMKRSLRWPNNIKHTNFGNIFLSKVSLSGTLAKLDTLLITNVAQLGTRRLMIMIGMRMIVTAGEYVDGTTDNVGDGTTTTTTITTNANKDKNDNNDNNSNHYYNKVGIMY